MGLYSRPPLPPHEPVKFLQAKLLSRPQAHDLWAGFYHAYGATVMYDAYGWTAPTARPMQRREYVFEFVDPAMSFERVGWGGTRFDEMDNEVVYVSVGVFPQWQRRGYRLFIRDWVAEWSATQGAKLAKVEVFKDNERHYNRTIHESMSSKCEWTYAGDVWYPAPGYGIFVRDLCPEPEAAEAAMKEAA